MTNVIFILLLILLFLALAGAALTIVLRTIFGALGGTAGFLGTWALASATLGLAFYIWQPTILNGDFWLASCFRNYGFFIGKLDFGSAFKGYSENLRWSVAAAPNFLVKLIAFAALIAGSITRSRINNPEIEKYSWLLTPAVVIVGIYLGGSLLIGLLKQPFISGIFDSLYRMPFIEMVLNTLLIVGGILFLTLVVGLSVALLINRSFPGRGIARVLLISPFFIMPAVNALMWKNLMLHPTNGIIAFFANAFGYDAPVSLFDANYGAFGIILIVAWQWTPFAILIFMTSLQSEDQEQKEAAILDGASAWSQFWNLTLPHLGRPIAIVMMIQLIFHLSLYAEIFYTGAGAGAGTLAYAIDTAGLSGGQNFSKAAAGGVFAIILANMAALVLIRIVGRNLTD